MEGRQHASRGTNQIQPKPRSIPPFEYEKHPFNNECQKLQDPHWAVDVRPPCTYTSSEPHCKLKRHTEIIPAPAECHQ